MKLLEKAASPELLDHLEECESSKNPMKLLTYKKFNDKEVATHFVQTLREHGILSEITEERGSLDSLYGDKHFDQQYLVKLNHNDFEKADLVLAKQSQNAIERIDRDHYLYGFTNEELREILSKPDEWGELDYQLSRKLLSERGETFSDLELSNLKHERIADLSKPQESSSWWILMGYISAVLGGLIGIFIGWYLNTLKKTLPNGQQVYVYAPSSRRHGTKIFILGIIALVGLIVTKVIIETTN